MNTEEMVGRRGFFKKAGLWALGLVTLPLFNRAKDAQAVSSRLTITDLARNRRSIYPEGKYDHGLQQLTNRHGRPIAGNTNTGGDEDAGGSTTFWDGEST
ncbi:MAG: hypothetical protein JRI52_08740 [Deltaproteobacteria bacterium]|nr:hypothetical protein [Deltaproteobacteria bacterium]